MCHVSLCGLYWTPNLEKNSLDLVILAHIYINVNVTSTEMSEGPRVFSCATALAKQNLSNLSCVFLCRVAIPQPGNGISTRNFFISSLDLGSASKFTLE